MIKEDLNSLQIGIPMVLTAISLCVMLNISFYSRVCGCCKQEQEKENALGGGGNKSKAAKQTKEKKEEEEEEEGSAWCSLDNFSVFIDIVTVACLIWGISTSFPLRDDIEPTCPSFLEDYRTYHIERKNGLILPLVLVVLTLFIKSPYFLSFMTVLGLYEAAVLIQSVTTAVEL
jgi:hypothetical protein